MKIFDFIERAINIAIIYNCLDMVATSDNTIGFKYLSDITVKNNKYGKFIVFEIGNEPCNIYLFLTLLLILYEEHGDMDIQLLSEDSKYYLDVYDIEVLEKFGNKYYIVK